jgi:hypothetical protein
MGQAIMELRRLTLKGRLKIDWKTDPNLDASVQLGEMWQGYFDTTIKYAPEIVVPFSMQSLQIPKGKLMNSVWGIEWLAERICSGPNDYVKWIVPPPPRAELLKMKRLPPGVVI